MTSSGSQSTRRAWPIRVRVMALGLAALAAFAGYRAWDGHRRAPADDAPRTEFEVDGLDCPVWCAVRLVENIDALDGARVERLDQEQGRVVVRHDQRQDRAAIEEVLRASGFPVRARSTEGQDR